MIVGYVPTANRTLEVIYQLNKRHTTELLAKVEKDLCTKGKTESHYNISIYNSLLVYLTLIYTDINRNTLTVKNTTYYKCKYNWDSMVSKYACLGYDIQKLAEAINLFTKQETSTCTVTCT